jgi:SulP family sulfate permease
MARTRYRFDSGLQPLRSLPAAALRAVLREGYTRADLRADVLAGAVVGVVALPLAMALAVAVGVAPQHGLYTAIVAGFLAAALGGSRTQVSGPTAAFVVVLAPIYVRFGLSGLLFSALFGGLIMMAMGLARFGRFIQFIPHPVTTGFTAGIATVIALLQLKDVLGLRVVGNPEHLPERVIAMASALHTTQWTELSLAALTLTVLVMLPRFTKMVPAPLVALPLAAVVAMLLERLLPGVEIATIATRFQTEIDGRIVPGIPQLPPMPMFPWNAPGPGGHSMPLSIETVRVLGAGAFAVAMLGAIESLLSAVVADGMSRTRHDPDAELLAIGFSNVAASLFGGIPATGAIARTATNIRSGARSPIAAMTHALVVLGAMLLLAPLLGLLPMSALSALLLLVAWNMSEVKHFGHMLRVAPRSDVVVLITCYVLTVMFDMVMGVSVGMVLAALLFMRRMALVTEARLANPEQLRLDMPIPEGVALYEISGALFFGAAQKAMGALETVGTKATVVVLDVEEVHVMDATGLVALESALDQLTAQRRLAILSGVQSQPLEVLERAGVTRREGVKLARSAKEALAMAQEFLSERKPTPPPATPAPASSSGA